ncbi:DUF5916 domain-containing protein [Fulvivirga lutimaris]|uniref:DUF5916 domain-containing protein n=1 Tax=Fulvivirga lutimaris TaxID=1819566 RepID=UPI0012BC9486|nr:DUF5916 domain-containing protein [Fulvivirga lutimaris]MTI40832.1 hypothetical protein [Fulvivirga lutimaris]
MRKYRLFYMFVSAFAGAGALEAQDIDTRAKFKYQIERATNPVKIDGIESVGEWNNYQLIDTMYNHNPSDVGLSKNRSEIRMTYDDINLYIIAKNYDEGRRVIQSLQRDSDNSQWGSDAITIAIDPINKKQSGVMFGVNAGGAELDGRLEVEPSRTTYSETWDERWFSATKQYKDHWLVEIALPFSSLRFNVDNLEWGINFIRGDKVENYYYTWTPFPINFNGIDVNYMGTLKWKEVPKVRSKILFLKPYTTLSALKNTEEESASTEYNADAGVDAKISITKSLNADIAYNPDFSNADVDEEITNITRFDISLPERREFFMENADIFSNFGSYDVNPFFSRRVGLITPIHYGARITGNVTDNLRLGVMNIRTKSDTAVDAQNHTVGAFNYKVLNRSQIKGLFVNRQEVGNENINDYSRNFGAEFTYISKNGNFNNNIKFHQSATDENRNGSYLGVQGNYITRTFGSGWTLDVLDKDYEADLGFTPRIFNYDAENDETVRQGYTLFNPWVRFTHYTKNTDSKIISHTIRTWHNFYFDGEEAFYERQNNIAYDLRFLNTSSITVSAHNRQVELQFETNFLGDEFDNLPKDKYNFSSTSISYTSDERKKFTYNASATYGDFFNGNITTIGASSNIRIGYRANFSLSYDYNSIRLPENFGEVDLHLFKVKGLFSLTNKLFFNNTIQYNTQSTNFSVFSKLQWRYAPLSDIFLIYNENKDTDSFSLINRSIILKLTYRLGF